MARPFLTARWEHLCLFTYPVQPELLRPHLPAALEPDTREGQAFVSLVGFNFQDTRVFGVSWPGYRAFPELNLRCYVRHGDRRGVLFIREIVPSRLVSLIAHRFYNEPYVAAPLRHQVAATGNAVRAAGELTWRRQPQRYEVECAAQPFLPGAESTEHFFKEHHWGYGRDRRGRLLEYEVRHPVWEVLPVRGYRLAFDFAAVYGQQWAMLNHAEPTNVLCAVGSAVEVYPPAG